MYCITKYQMTYNINYVCSCQQLLDGFVSGVDENWPGIKICVSIN